MLFDKLCRYIAYGWSSVETQQIPAILEMGRWSRAHGSEVPHARRAVPQVVTTIECHYAVTESTFGIVRRWSWDTRGVSTAKQDLERQVDALSWRPESIPSTSIATRSPAPPSTAQDWPRCCVPLAAA